MRIYTKRGNCISKFLLFSLALHLLIAGILWRYAEEPTGNVLTRDSVLAEFFHIKYAKPTVRKQPPPAEPSKKQVSPSQKEIIQPPIAAGSFALSMVTSTPGRRDSGMTSKSTWSPTVAERENLDLLSSQVSSSSRVPSSASSPPVQRTRVADHQDTPISSPNGLLAEVKLTTGETLSSGSPDPRADGWTNTGVRRGDGGSSWYAYGNANPQPGRSDGTFRGLMIDLAKQIVSQSSNKKLDVVFVVDATGSMKDNIRGIRAYLGHFAERLRRDGKDAAFGAVIFTDMIVEKPKARGVTDDYNDVRNWLYHTEYMGGGDLAESGLEALMTAIHKIDYRRGAERFLVLVTDGPVHDADYDGQSEYTLDQVIGALRDRNFRVDVVGIDYLPLRQIARATQGRWFPIPGRGYLEEIPYTAPEKSLSGMGLLTQVAAGQFEIVVTASSAEWVRLTWKVLNPFGEICYSPVSQQKPAVGEPITFQIRLPVESWEEDPFPYTLICSVEDSSGRKGILRSVIWSK